MVACEFYEGDAIPVFFANERVAFVFGRLDPGFWIQGTIGLHCHRTWLTGLLPSFLRRASMVA